MKQKFEIKPEAMSYDNQELTIETQNHIFKIKDKRVICILADRLTELKKQINSSTSQGEGTELTLKVPSQSSDKSPSHYFSG